MLSVSIPGPPPPADLWTLPHRKSNPQGLVPMAPSLQSQALMASRILVYCNLGNITQVFSGNTVKGIFLGKDSENWLGKQ